MSDENRLGGEAFGVEAFERERQQWLTKRAAPSCQRGSSIDGGCELRESVGESRLQRWLTHLRLRTEETSEAASLSNGSSKCYDSERDGSYGSTTVVKRACQYFRAHGDRFSSCKVNERKLVRGMKKEVLEMARSEKDSFTFSRPVPLALVVQTLNESTDWRGAGASVHRGNDTSASWLF